VNLLIIRHGPAGDPEAWQAEGKDDRVRPLTPKGKKEMRRAAGGLARVVPELDVLATSPLTRAAQTAEIVAREYGCQVETVEELTADHQPQDLLPWLQQHQDRETVAVVGHEPHLGLLAGYLLTGKSVSFVDLKKGGACLIQVADTVKPGSGTLEWLLTDRDLRRLAK
jgi:phosphohistidine phosphatase